MSRAVAAPTAGRLGALVYELVKERLLDGEFPAGERISLEALKSELQVSKQPVMDAMRRLASDGLVEIIPQVGCRVPHYDATEVGDFYAMFSRLEGAVTGIAATRWSGDQLVALRDLNERTSRLADEPDPGRRSHGYRVLNREFHTAIHHMAASRMVVSTSQRLWDLSDLLINTTGRPQPLAGAIPERAREHEDICVALADRDESAARAAMERHILGTPSVIHGTA